MTAITNSSIKERGDAALISLKPHPQGRKMGAYLLEKSFNISRQDFQNITFNFLAEVETWRQEKKFLLNKTVCFIESEIIKKGCMK